MVTSILNDTKKALGIDETYTAFDPEVTMHINSALSTLGQLGLGPDAGFAIDDDSAVWSDFLGGDPRLNSAKSYVYLSVRMVFDPPQTSFLINALKDQKQELATRLLITREEATWEDPTTGIDEEEVLIIDGGEI